MDRLQYGWLEEGRDITNKTKNQSSNYSTEIRLGKSQQLQQTYKRIQIKTTIKRGAVGGTVHKSTQTHIERPRTTNTFEHLEAGRQERGQCSSVNKSQHTIKWLFAFN